MKKEFSHTKVTVKLRPSEHKKEWYLYIESYPVNTPSGKKRIKELLNRTISTPIFEKKDGRGSREKVKRDNNGIIVCKSLIDRESCQYADAVRKLRQKDYDNRALFSDAESEMNEYQEKSQLDFLGYVASHIVKIRKTESQASSDHWTRMYQTLKEYIGKDQLRFADISVALSNGYKEYLLSLPCAGNKKGTISHNTAASYFSIYRAALKRAFEEGYLISDISGKVKSITQQEGHREYLTLDEVNMLAKTDCDNPVIKRAALFSILTGFRHVDIKNLTWRNIRCDGDRYTITITQQKTKVAVTKPIPLQAYLLCGNRGADDTQVFEGLPDPSWINRPVNRWVKAAGITKHITFHCFRHTYATLQLASGTDIYTVSKLLGHTNVATTQIYAKVVDEKKDKAANAIEIELIPSEITPK